MFTYIFVEGNFSYSVKSLQKKKKIMSSQDSRFEFANSLIIIWKMISFILFKVELTTKSLNCLMTKKHWYLTAINLKKYIIAPWSLWHIAFYYPSKFWTLIGRLFLFSRYYQPTFKVFTKPFKFAIIIKTWW